MSAPSQISIFPATSASASRLAELLQQQHPEIRVRLAARSPAKLQSAGTNVTVSPTPLDTSNVAAIKDALQGSDAAYVMNPPFYGEKDPFALSQAYVDSLVQAANASSTLKRIVFLSSVGAEQTSGTGPIRNVHIAENGLLANLRDGIEAIALRPPYFLSNFSSVLHLAINPPHILPSMVIPFAKAYSFTDASAIASKALKYLVAPPSTVPDAASRSHLTAVQLITDKKTVPELAEIVSEIAGVQVNPVPIAEEDWFSTFKNAGMPDDLANLFVELTAGMVHDRIVALEGAAIEQEKQRGITVISEQTDVDHKAALKHLVDQVKQSGSSSQ